MRSQGAREKRKKKTSENDKVKANQGPKRNAGGESAERCRSILPKVYIPWEQETLRRKKDRMPKPDRKGNPILKNVNSTIHFNPTRKNQPKKEIRHKKKNMPVRKTTCSSQGEK